jgi:DNA invertase Pin-like site-specific DNA recombinase
MPERAKFVGYVRVSTCGQAEDGVSVDAQTARLMAYAVAMDVELVDVVVDAGYSAKTLERPGMKRVLGMLDRGEIAGVIVTKLDRITRSLADLGMLVDRYFTKAASLLSVSDSIDTRTASGRLVLNVLGSVSQWEREIISERTKEAMSHIKREGARIGRLPLGYKRSEEIDVHGRREVVEDPEGQALVRRVIELSGSHGIREVARIVSRETGRNVWPTQVRRILARG